MSVHDWLAAWAAASAVTAVLVGPWLRIRRRTTTRPAHPTPPPEATMPVTTPDPEHVAMLRRDAAENGPIDWTTPEGRARGAALDDQWHARASGGTVTGPGHLAGDHGSPDQLLHALPPILAPDATVTCLPIGPAPLRCGCGSEWFRLTPRPNDPPNAAHGAIAFTQDGSVRAYTGEPTCIECGDKQVIQ